MTIADLAAHQSLYKRINFRPSRTDCKYSFSLGLLFALVVGKVNTHFTGLVDGVFVRLDSINLGYWNSTATLVASTNIIERNCLLARMGLGSGLHYGSANGNDCRLRFGVGHRIAGRFGDLGDSPSR